MNNIEEVVTPSEKRAHLDLKIWIRRNRTLFAITGFFIFLDMNTPNDTPLSNPVLNIYNTFILLSCSWWIIRLIGDLFDRSTIARNITKRAVAVYAGHVIICAYSPLIALIIQKMLLSPERIISLFVALYIFQSIIAFADKPIRIAFWRRVNTPEKTLTKK